MAGSGESLDCCTSSAAPLLTCEMWSRAQTSWVLSFLLENGDFLFLSKNRYLCSFNMLLKGAATRGSQSAAVIVILYSSVT